MNASIRRANLHDSSTLTELRYCLYLRKGFIPASHVLAWSVVERRLGEV
jgi:hypothetical protein